MTLYAVLLIGLVAGGGSTAATQRDMLTRSVLRQGGYTGHSGAGDQTGWARLVERLADELTPVAAHLAGKITSHTIIGALLGAAGASIQLSATGRTMTQFAAGIAMIVFGLAQLGLPGLRAASVEPAPGSLRPIHRGLGFTGAAAPAVLGAVSVLMPCRATLAVEALALASGSPATGSAIMFIFVAGTVPLFTGLRHVAGKADIVWRGRLATLTGLLVLIMGVYTVSGGFDVVGAPLAACRAPEAVPCGPGPVPSRGGPGGAHPLSGSAEDSELLVIRADGIDPGGRPWSVVHLGDVEQRRDASVDRGVRQCTRMGAAHTGAGSPCSGHPPPSRAANVTDQALPQVRAARVFVTPGPPAMASAGHWTGFEETVGIPHAQTSVHTGYVGDVGPLAADSAILIAVVGASGYTTPLDPP